MAREKVTATCQRLHRPNLNKPGPQKPVLEATEAWTTAFYSLDHETAESQPLI